MDTQRGVYLIALVAALVLCPKRSKQPTWCREQGLRGVKFPHLAVVHDEDAVGVYDRVESVRDSEQSALFETLAHHRKNEAICLVILRVNG